MEVGNGKRLSKKGQINKKGMTEEKVTKDMTKNKGNKKIRKEDHEKDKKLIGFEECEK